MRSIHLRFTDNFSESVAEVEKKGGQVLHRLGASAFVVSLPADISPDALRSSSSKQPETIGETEKMVVEAWKEKFSPKRERSMTILIGEGKGWGSHGFQAPGHYDPGEKEDSKIKASVERSTGIPTSRTLTGSVAVGIIIVSGYPWTQIEGKLKHISAAADGTVWGVNSSDTIYRRTGSTWTSISGKLKQISVGSSAHIWGVNQQRYDLSALRRHMGTGEWKPQAHLRRS